MKSGTGFNGLERLLIYLPNPESPIQILKNPKLCIGDRGFEPVVGMVQ